ncbi:MAG: 30S ribosomal protein S19e [Halobacteriales archaeon]|nr:30S ribosomal protein S19e [Halobacteriales archaeon]
MVTLHDAPADELIAAVASTLEDEIDEPEWATFAKSGAGRELPPEQSDFWYTRAASLLRKVAIDGPVGVERLATEYGDKKAGSTRYRVAPAHRSDGSQKVIRTILQQLEEAGYIESGPSNEGRIASPEGRSLLDETAGDVIDDLDRPELERYV